MPVDEERVAAGAAGQVFGSSEYHVPVMQREALELLAVSRGVYLDATLGGGGHSQAILEQLQDGILIGIDMDRDALSCAGKRLSRFQNTKLLHGNFADMESLVSSVPEARSGLAGILFDLGLSRHQAVTPERGFSYQSKGPLDMRFDQSAEMATALDLVQRSSEQELQRIIRELGEERFYRRIGWRIDQARGQIRSTSDLAETIRRAVPFRFQAKAVMRVFQALRLAVNRELDNLRTGLRAAISLLADEGRIVVVAYHSLEDRIVKHTLREFQALGAVRILTKRPLRPSDDEVAANPSARSARLRAAARTVQAIAA